MKINIHTYFTLLFLLLFMYSCKESDIPVDLKSAEDSYNPPASNTSFLAIFSGDLQKKYKATSFTISLGDIPMEQPCRKDDIITIKSDKTFSYNSGGTLCGSEDNKTTRMGTWTYNHDKTEITFNFDNFVAIAKVLSVTDDTLILSGTYLGFKLIGTFQIQSN